MLTSLEHGHIVAVDRFAVNRLDLSGIGGISQPHGRVTKHKVATVVVGRCTEIFLCKAQDITDALRTTLFITGEDIAGHGIA